MERAAVDSGGAVVLSEPVGVSPPEPVTASANDPLPFSSVPVNSVLLPSPPTVRITSVSEAESVTVPLPESEPIDWLWPARSSVELTTKSELSLSASVAPALSVPLVIVVEPEYVVVALSVSVLEPARARATVPLPSSIVPLNVSALVLRMVNTAVEPATEL